MLGHRITKYKATARQYQYALPEVFIPRYFLCRQKGVLYMLQVWMVFTRITHIYDFCSHAGHLRSSVWLSSPAPISNKHVHQFHPQIFPKWFFPISVKSLQKTTKLMLENSSRHCAAECNRIWYYFHFASTNKSILLYN